MKGTVYLNNDVLLLNNLFYTFLSYDHSLLRTSLILKHLHILMQSYPSITGNFHI